MDTSDLQSLLNDLAGKAAPGLALCLSKDSGRTSLLAGLDRAGRDGALSLAARYPIGHICKSLLSLLVLDHALRGRLDLDDPIETSLPELASRGAAPPVTWRHIISQTTGVADLSVRDLGDGEWDDFAFAFARRQQAFSPGTVWSGGECGHLALARLLELVAGKPAPQLVWERVLLPLGVRPSDDAGMVGLHSPPPGRAPELPPPLHLTPLFSAVFPPIHLTIEELGLLAQLLSARLDHPLSTAAREMHAQTSQIPPMGMAAGELPPTSFGLGLASFGGLLGVRHLGSGSACGLMFDPDSGVAVAAAVNAANPTVRDMLLLRGMAKLGAMTRVSAAASQLVALPGLAGSYGGLAMGYEAARIASDGRCEVEFARGLVECSIRSDRRGGLFLEGPDRWSMPMGVFAHPQSGQPALMIGGSAFVRCGDT